MADAPSPYAPGLIADERAAPRPAGRPVVFLVATFAMTVVASQWPLLAPQAMSMTGGRAPTTPVNALTSIPAALIFLWAYLSDAVPLLGRRREGYVMVCCLMAAALWAALAVAGDHDLTWLVAAAPFGLAAAVSRAAILGALAEIGRRRAATGRLAAAHNGLAQLAALMGQAALWLVLPSMTWTAGAAIGLALAVVLLIATLWDDETPVPVPAQEPRPSIPAFLRSRAFWTQLPVILCAAAASLPPALLNRRVRATHDTGIDTLLTQWWSTTAAAIVAAIAYALLCRRIPLRNLLRLTLLLKALVLVACGRMLQIGETRELDASLLLLSASGGLVTVAMLDLAMRAAPRGREAFGVILLVGIGSMMAMLMNTLLFALGASLATAAWLATAAAVVAAITVSFLPAALVARADGRVIGSPP